jgi:hypothetical protein
MKREAAQRTQLYQCIRRWPAAGRPAAGPPQAMACSRSRSWSGRAACCRASSLRSLAWPWLCAGTSPAAEPGQQDRSELNDTAVQRIAHRTPALVNHSCGRCKHTAVIWTTAIRQAGTGAHYCIVHVAELVHQLRQDELEAIPADLRVRNEQSSAGGVEKGKTHMITGTC